MGMDLMNLSKSLQEGIRIPREDNRVVIVTPIGRIDYPHLVNARVPPPNQDGSPGRPYYGLRMIWNWNLKDQPAHVNINVVLNPAIGEIAQRAGLNPKGHLRRGDEEKLQRADGSWPDGIGPGTVFAAINTTAINKDGSMRPAPLVRDSKRNVLDPKLAKPGYYGRAVCSIFHVTHGGVGKLCFGLEELQLLAKGELLGGGGARDYAGLYDAVDGETFENEPPSQIPMDGDDDIPF